MHTVSILGCGWLGLPLAEKLIADGYELKGSTSSQPKLDILADKSIQPYLINLPQNKPKKDFFDSDFLIINIPPGTRKLGLNHHLECIQSILADLPAHQKIIYVSATSVYPDKNGKITESTAVNSSSDRAKALWQVENLLKMKVGKNLSIIRLGGLLGYDRIPGKYFEGKIVEQHQQKVNYIHRDDAVGIIIKIINIGAFGEIFNGVAPQHPTKKEVYLKNADQFKFERPEFPDVNQMLVDRFIDSSKIELNLDYSFIYPDPIDFFYIK